jgi:uncharacterized protein
MDTLLIIAGLILSILGILGCILPALAGPPLSFLGLLLIHFTDKISLPPSLLWVMGILTVLVSILEYVVPIWGTRRFGGTKNGAKGAIIGLMVGFFIGPMGMIVGPFAGAMLGEMVGGRQDRGILRAAFGSFLGFLLGIGLKLTVSLAIFFYWLAYVIPVLF